MRFGKATALFFVWFASGTALAGERMTFDAFLTKVNDQNLGLKIEAAKAEASRENAKGLSIPPPMVGYVRMTDQSGSSANGFEINQMIPFPSKISNDRSARKFEAEAQEEARLGMTSEIFAQARVLYLSLWVSQQKKEALKEKKGVIEDHIKLARAGVRSDSFLRIHLLKSESDLDFMENEILSADQEILEKEITVAKFLNVDPGSFHPLLEEPSLITLPPEDTAAPSHQFESARLSLESFRAREQEAKSVWFPDLYLRYKETGETRLMPRLSEVMIGVSLPFVFPWNASATAGKSSALKVQAEFEFEKEKRKIDSEKSTFFVRAISLKKQIDNIKQKLIPRAEKRMKLVHNLAPRDMETLQDHRDTMEAFPDLKLKALDLRVQYETAVAELRKYMRDQK